MRGHDGARGHGGVRRAALALGPARKGFPDPRKRPNAKRGAGANSLSQRSVRFIGGIERERFFDREECLVSFSGGVKHTRQRTEISWSFSFEFARAFGVFSRRCVIGELDEHVGQLRMGRRAPRGGNERRFKRCSRAQKLPETLVRNSGGEVGHPRGVLKRDAIGARHDRFKVGVFGVMGRAEHSIDFKRHLRIFQGDATTLRFRRERGSGSHRLHAVQHRFGFIRLTELRKRFGPSERGPRIARDQIQHSLGELVDPGGTGDAVRLRLQREVDRAAKDFGMGVRCL